MAYCLIQFEVKIVRRPQLFQTQKLNNLFILQVSVALTVRSNICIMSSFIKHFQDILGTIANKLYQSNSDIATKSTVLQVSSKNNVRGVGMEKREMS